MNNLMDLASKISNGKVEIVDLTHTLSENFPSLVLPPELGQVSPFKKTEISHYNEKGPDWYWNDFSCGEHTGTHFDAPKHWVSGKEYENGYVDTLPVKNFIAPACVIDASKEVAENVDFVLSVEFIQNWEKEHGEIKKGSWVLFRTDWYKKDFKKDFANIGEEGLPHTPGPSKEAVEYMIKKDVIGFGVETINTDAGLSFTWEFQLPCHTLMHGAGKYGLQCLKNLDKLPPTNSIIVAAPLKIEQGSGSPLRVIALVEH